jgi:hypothetical protein
LEVGYGLFVMGEEETMRMEWDLGWGRGFGDGEGVWCGRRARLMTFIIEGQGYSDEKCGWDTKAMRA